MTKVAKIKYLLILYCRVLDSSAVQEVLKMNLN